MADTLEKIYDNTLTDSSFDSNGEATIITTDSSTRHVIKDIKIIEGDADIPISGTLQDNGHDLVGLTANSNGSEIIGTSSTVKVKTSNIPLSYVDHEIYYQTSSTNIQAYAEPFVNLKSGKATGGTSDDTISSWTQDSTWRQYWSNIGPNNNDVYLHNNNNSTHAIYIRNSSGTQIYAKTTSYRPHWFDGTRYIYFMESQYLYRIDVHAGGMSASAHINIGTTPSYSTYPKMFGYKDQWVIGWSTQNDNVYLFDLQNLTATNIGQNQSLSLNFIDKNAGLVRTSNGTYYIIKQNTNNDLYKYEFDPLTTNFGSSTASFETIALGANSANDHTCSFAYIGSRVYYKAHGDTICFVDFETETPTKGIVYESVPSSHNGADFWGIDVTPDASTISGRTYNVSPSLKLRITGVTSA